MKDENKLRELKKYFWHKKPVELLIRPSFKKGTIRNCKIRMIETGKEMIVPFRALRRRGKYDKENVEKS